MGAKELRELGQVSGEGGPFLLADRDVAQQWHGIEGDDYQRACEILGESPENHLIEVGGEDAVLWEMGEGTAFVFKESDTIVSLVHCFLDEKTTVLDLAAQAPEAERRVGDLEIKSGVLCVLWAPEDGSVLTCEPGTEASRPRGEVAIDGSALCLRVPAGIYGTFCDEYDLDGGSARRCRLVRRFKYPGRKSSI